MHAVTQPAVAGNDHVHPSDGPPEPDDVAAWRGPSGETIVHRSHAAVAAARFLVLLSAFAAGGAP